MTFVQHGTRCGLLLVLAAALLTFLSARTEIMFADGLRYVHQAAHLDAGNLAAGLHGSVDHPVYPLAIVLAHRAIGGEGPAAWQSAAQAASVFFGIMLVVPLYLVAIELFGPAAAWLCVLLVYISPVPPRVMADALSESTFLFFWTWGLYAALRFLKQGTFGWLPLMIGCTSLAYLTRPEGLLLPLVMVLTLAAMPALPALRLNWPRWWAAVAFLVIGPIVLVGPYVALKGGLGTKPAVARILGTAPKSPANAVERARPLDPNQSAIEHHVEAGKEALGAIRDCISLVLVPFSLLGVWSCRPLRARSRLWLFITLLFLMGYLGLARLYSTGGYCTPRHALLLGLLGLSSAGAGIDYLLRSVKIPGRLLGLGDESLRPGPAAWLLTLGALMAIQGSELLAPLNQKVAGYRQAGLWLAEHSPADGVVVDVTGWSQFYGERKGYTFTNLIEAPGDPSVRYVVAREAHLAGPWDYCAKLKQMTAGLKPVAAFPEKRVSHRARILVFDRMATPGEAPPSVASKADPKPL